MTWDYDLAVGEIDHTVHTGLLLAEDAALKTYLSGITVPGREGMTEAAVWFRYPEGERRIQYPFITIDFLAIEPSYDRWTSYFRIEPDYAEFRDPVTTEVVRTGMYIPSVSDTLPALEGDEGLTDHVVENYLMHVITYQVTVHSRSAIHDRYLTSRFMTDIFPPRPFFIGVDADMTWRRCEMMGVQAADTSETTESGNKRIFRKIYTIRMDAEIPQSRVTEVATVQRLHADVYADTPSRELVTHLYDDAHAVGEPVTVEPPPGS